MEEALHLQMTRAKRYITAIEEQSGSRNANDNIEAFASLAHSVQVCRRSFAHGEMSVLADSDRLPVQ